MPLSYRNMIDTNQLADALTTGDYSKVIKKKNNNLAKYIKGYANQSALEQLGKAIDPNMSLDIIRQSFGIENKQLDAYDPYHTSDAKKENFWFDSNNTSGSTLDGKTIQSKTDPETNLFKRGLYSQYGFRQNEYQYEDPFIPSFEIIFDENSPLFDVTVTNNSLTSFLNKYSAIAPISYTNRSYLWKEFLNIFFKIFQNKNQNDYSNPKIYYISKISGLNLLNKRIINYGEDKITITMNEDVAMTAWYLSELYNNIVYSYKDQRFMFPENVLRFNMIIKINDIRNFQIPENNSQSGPNTPTDRNTINQSPIKYTISPKSQIVYQLNDCNFNFFESKNYGEEIEIGGWGTNQYTPQSLTFDIFFKSVTRYSSFPLIQGSYNINGWELGSSDIKLSKSIPGTIQDFNLSLDKIKQQASTEPKSYLDQLKAKGAQTVVNAAANYMDNLETRLREVRGSAVNKLLQQFRDIVKINKIEPDNVYNTDFNNRVSVSNLGKSLSSTLLNQLENEVKNTSNF